MAVTPTTWNPADKDSGGGTLSGGDRTYNGGTGGVRSTFGATAGKYYWEVEYPSGEYNQRVGVATSASDLDVRPGDDAYSWAMDTATGDIYNSGVVVASSAIGSPYVVVSVLLDATAKELRYRINDIDIGVVVSLVGSEFFAVVGYFGETTANFGDSVFARAPPAGYQAGLGASVATGETIAVGGVHTTRAGAPAVMPGPNRVAQPGGAFAALGGMPALQIGYPQTIGPDGGMVAFAGAPTLLPYANKSLRPAGRVVSRGGAPVAISAPIVVGPRPIIVGGRRAMHAGAPSLNAAAFITPTGALATKPGGCNVSAVVNPPGMLPVVGGTPALSAAISVPGTFAVSPGVPAASTSVYVSGAFGTKWGVPTVDGPGVTLVSGSLVTHAGTPRIASMALRTLGRVHAMGGTPKATRSMRC